MSVKVKSVDDLEFNSNSRRRGICKYLSVEQREAIKALKPGTGFECETGKNGSARKAQICICQMVWRMALGYKVVVSKNKRSDGVIIWRP